MPYEVSLASFVGRALFFVEIRKASKETWFEKKVSYLSYYPIRILTWKVIGKLRLSRNYEEAAGCEGEQIDR